MTRYAKATDCVLASSEVEFGVAVRWSEPNLLSTFGPEDRKSFQCSNRGPFHLC